MEEQNYPESERISKRLQRMPQLSQTRSTRGLKYLSIKVKDMVIKCGATTYQNVATRLIADLKQTNPLKASETEKDEKNVRRRVYDALNVLIAAGVLRKNYKKEVEHNTLADPSKIVIRD